MKIIKQLENIRQQSGSVSKIILIALGVLIVGLIVAMTVFKNSNHNDAFNYANENASQLTENRNQWSTIEWLEPIKLILDQSRAVFYWQSTSELSWKCTNKDGFDQGPTGEIVIRHNDCLLYLPAHNASIKATQSDLVMIRPQVDSEIDVTQSTLRIAENGHTYTYDIESKNSEIDSFKSGSNTDVQLTIFAVESEISEY